MPPLRRLLRTAALAAIVCAVYYAGAWIGFRVTFPSLPTSIFWLPNATMFAVFLLVPPRRYWLYALAVLPAHLAIQLANGAPTLSMLLLYPSNLADAALAALAVRRFGGSGPPLRGLRSVAVFVAAAVAAPLLVSFLDAAIVVAGGWAHDYDLIWRTRFRSNVLTNLLWVPAVVVGVTRAPGWLRRAALPRQLEAALLGLAVAGTAAIVFGMQSSTSITPLVYAPLPLFFWAAARFEVGGASAVLLVFASMVIWSATHGLGPFSQASPAQNTAALQVFLTLVTAPSLLLASLFGEQRLAKLAIADREAQYRGIFESTSDGILVTDRQNAVAAVNPAFSRLTGYGTERLREVHPRSFLHLDDIRPLDAYLDAVKAGGSLTTQAMCASADGRLTRVELHGTSFQHGGRAHVLSVVRDITEREQAFGLLERKVAERTRELSTLLQISKTIASTLNLHALIGLVLVEIEKLFDCTGATLMISDGDELVEWGHHGPLTSPELANTRFPNEWAFGPPEARRDSPLLIHNLWDGSPTSTAFRAAAPPGLLLRHRDARSLLVVPLKARDEPVGVLLIASDEPERFQLPDAQVAWGLGNQAAVAIENARLYDQARELAAMEERQRIAHDLHDSVTQSVYSASMMARALPMALERDPPQARRMVAHIDEVTSSAVAELRTLLIELRPSEALQSDLGELLRQLAKGLRSRIEKPIRVEVAEGVCLPAEVQVTFYRLAQAAFGNIVKHAASAQARITLEANADSATLVIADDGPGFDLAQAVGHEHMGLEIMRERARSVGATLAIDSAPGRGTRLTFGWSAPKSDALFTRH